jgi:hypothetical protein
MKLKIFYFSSFLCALFLIVLSCKRDVSQDITSSKRSEFTKGKNVEVIKADYTILPVQSKKTLWIEKIQQIITQKLPSQQLAIIKELETELLRGDCDFTSFSRNTKIQEIGIRLASITPKEDFINMFVSLNDYQYKNAFVGKDICVDCIKDMESDSKNLGNTNGTLQVRLADCNCNWTCGQGDQTTSDCKPTSIGCGFLWLGSCRKRDCYSCAAG